MIQERLFKEFQQFEDVPMTIIEKYENKIPIELLNIWKEFGFGSFLNGFLKIINPDDYMSLLETSYFNSNEAIPIMITAFGDILIWENGCYVSIVSYRNNEFHILVRDFDLFLELLEEPTFLKRNFQLELYNECVSTYGALGYTQCFGCVLLQGFGGLEKIENFKKVKAKEHISLVVDILGGI